MLAHALANRLGVHFFKVDGASLTGSPLLGVPEGRVRALFTLARLIQPCVVFIDECESMLSARTGGGGEGGASAGKIVAQFLTELNDLPPHVVLVLASNMPWTLDPAITRRISCRVYIPLPDPGGRSALIRMDVARASVSLSAPAHALASPPSDSVFFGAVVQHLRCRGGPPRRCHAGLQLRRYPQRVCGRRQGRRHGGGRGHGARRRSPRVAPDGVR